jgi:hypothetical protein
VLLALAIPLTTSHADAAGSPNPCGNFDFTQSVSFDCKIEVSGGCAADCTPIKLEVACGGGCNVSTTTVCENDCATKCLVQCNPQALDCFAGCHHECDQPTIDECTQKHPNADCVKEATAQCDMHCKSACATPPNTCQAACSECCHGYCTTHYNFDCDFQCLADVQGGCSVQCQEPSGAIFCNGQYVHASDVQACIEYLATQGITVDVSARASGTCDLHGCTGTGSASGCAASPGSANGLAGALAFGAAAAVAGAIRSRRGKIRRR